MFRFVNVFLFLTYCGANGIDVETTLGRVRGSTLSSRLGDSFYAFRGIRYAEPPLGDLRFVNPLPVRSWAPNVYDATEDGPMCPQTTNNYSDVSEDCLRLNVYTKDVHASKPVLIYIHPGGYYSVSGQSKNFAGPQYLMDRDVVLVTLNYRLGTLGFLAIGTAAAPGNAGLKDQALAMRWVQSHIKNFGGDPQSVTLVGYSVGSFSIGLHMLSPMTKGLFHRGIAMSASPVGQFEYGEKDMHLAERQASLFECPKTPVQALVDCFKKKPTLDFMTTQANMFDFASNPIINWMPVIEKDFGQERYLVENPYKTIQSGNFSKVPLITGITEFEFLSHAYYTMLNETVLKGFDEQFEQYAPIAYLYERETRRSLEVSRQLRAYYFKNSTINFPNSLLAFGELLSDSVIGFEYHRFLTLMAQFVPVYTYFFRYKGRYSHFYYPPGSNQSFGAVHHDELLYLFNVPVMTPFFTKTDPENEIIERLTRMWAEFAAKGDPNNKSDPFLQQLSWQLYTPQNKEYLEISNNRLTSKTGGFYQDRYKQWDILFPVPSF